MVATCQTALASGSICGIQAIGRCATCEQAFCTSHQATDRGITTTSTYLDADGSPQVASHRNEILRTFVDRCNSCHIRAMQPVREASRRTPTNLLFALGSGDEAVRIMRATNVPKVTVIRVDAVSRKKRFRRPESVERQTPAGRGWIIGTILWRHNDGGSYGGGDISSRNPTVLLDQLGPSVEALGRVTQRKDETYQLLSGRLDPRALDEASELVHKMARRA